MLARCTDHARAFCRISIAELRRVAPPAFYVLMVISLLLADGLFPVFASKHRSQGSLYTSSNLARAGSGVNNGDVVLYARSNNNNNNNNNNNRYRTKARVKPFVSKKGDSVMSGEAGDNGNSNVGTDSGNSRLMRSRLHSQLHVRDVDASEGGSDRRRERERTDSRRINSGSSDNSGNDYEQLSLHLDERSASSSSQSLPSSLSSSPSSSSSLKPSPSLPSLPSSASSPSLASDSLWISNSSNNLGEGVRYPSGVTSSGAFPNDNDACQLISPIKQDACKTLVPSNQCLVLTAATAEMVCGKCQNDDRISFMRNARLRFCSSFPAARVSCASDTGAGGICPLIEQPSVCLDYLKSIVASDEKAEEMYDGFKGLIGRYDCTSNYSVKWHCHHCKQAYKDWLCSQNVNFLRSGQVVPPCMEFCSHVEEMCPFFRPKLNSSYAGDHSFICKDPHMNLPSTMPEENCYGLFDLWPRSKITEFYCSHANLHGKNCPLLVNQNFKHETTSPSNISISSNNTSSGASPMSSLSRTPTLSSFILPVFCMLTASLFRLPVTVTESQYIPEGLT